MSVLTKSKAEFISKEVLQWLVAAHITVTFAGAYSMPANARTRGTGLYLTSPSLHFVRITSGESPMAAIASSAVCPICCCHSSQAVRSSPLIICCRSPNILRTRLSVRVHPWRSARAVLCSWLYSLLSSAVIIGRAAACSSCGLSPSSAGAPVEGATSAASDANTSAAVGLNVSRLSSSRTSFIPGSVFMYSLIFSKASAVSPPNLWYITNWKASTKRPLVGSVA